MERIAAGLVALALVATASSASATRPQADLTPGCVDADEYNAVRTFHSKVQIDRYLNMHGERVLFSGEIDFDTAEAYPVRSESHVKFNYEGCTGDMWIIYKRGSTVRKWVQMDYDEN